MENTLMILNEVDNKINELRNRFDSNEVVFVYRGETKDNGSTKLMPSLFRNRDSNLIFNLENKMLEALSDFKVTNSTNVSLHKAIDAQHYIAKSRLLDVTYNILTAIYFAASSQEEDGKVYIIAIPKQFVFSAHSKYLINQFENEISNIKVNQSSSGVFKLITYSMINERIASQDGGFLMFSGHMPFQLPQFYYEVVDIKKETKLEVLKELSKFFNITKGKIYPEKSFKGEDIGIGVDNRNYNAKNYQVFEFELLTIKSYIELEYLRNIAKEDIEILKYKRQRRSLIDFVQNFKKNIENEIEHNYQFSNEIKIHLNEINKIEQNFLRKVKFL